MSAASLLAGEDTSGDNWQRCILSKFYNFIIMISQIRFCSVVKVDIVQSRILFYLSIFLVVFCIYIIFRYDYLVSLTLQQSQAGPRVEFLLQPLTSHVKPCLFEGYGTAYGIDQVDLSIYLHKLVEANLLACNQNWSPCWLSWTGYLADQSKC